MVATIRIGPEGGPYVKVEENNGTLDIITPNDTVDLQSNDLVNAALGGIMNAKGNDITNVNQLDANSVNTENAPTGDDEVLRWQEGLEVGSVAVSGLDNSAGNDDWGQSVSTTVSVSFDDAFDAEPYITAVRDKDQTSLSAIDWDFEVKNVAATGFDIEIHQIRARDRSGVGTAYGVSWSATNGR
jgi:hypothetical protein